MLKNKKLDKGNNMKKNKKLIIAVAITIIILLIVSNFNLFVSTQYISTNKIENNDTDIMISAIINQNVTKGILFVKPEKTADDSLISETKELEINYRYTHKESIGFGRFLPLYKPVSFSGTAVYQWDVVGDNSEKVSNSGAIEFSGEITIKGLSSPSNATKSIHKAIKKAIEDEINKEVNKQLFNKTSTKLPQNTKSTSTTISL